MLDVSTVAVLIWLKRYSTRSTRRVAFVILGGTAEPATGHRFVTTGGTAEPATRHRFVTTSGTAEPATRHRFVRPSSP
jgi:hypothetical protein